MVHVSAATGAAAIAARGRGGFPIYGETCTVPPLQRPGLQRPGGQMYHTYPSLKFAGDQKALWAAPGTARSRRSPRRVCCPLKVKTAREPHRRHDRRQFRVEPRVALMYTHMVAKQGYSLDEFVGLVSSNAAKIMGLYRRRARCGRLDADIVLLIRSGHG